MGKRLLFSSSAKEEEEQEEEEEQAKQICAKKANFFVAYLSFKESVYKGAIFLRGTLNS